MQHANILTRHDVNQLTRLNVSDLDEVRFKGKYIRIRQCEGIGVALPRNLPVRPRAPSVAVDKEGEIAVVEKEFSVHPFNVDRLDVLLPGNEIKRRIGLIQKRLTFRRFKTDNLKPSSTANAQRRTKEVNG